jgi:hypothetical protein
MNLSRKKKSQSEMTLNEMLEMMAKPHLEYYKTMLEDSGVRNTNMPEMYKGKTIEALIEEEKEKFIDNYCASYPEIGFMRKLQKMYGDFVIHANYDTSKSGNELMLDLLVRKCNKFCISNPNIVFYNKKEYKRIEHLDDSIAGDNISEICKKFINTCLDYRYVVHFKTDKGEGYATTNIRQMVLESGFDICIN